jgi:hypothetical protein
MMGVRSSVSASIGLSLVRSPAGFVSAIRLRSFVWVGREGYISYGA